jgi:Rad3-related DNA helicase
MAKDASHDLKDVAVAVRRQRLAGEDIKLLRSRIAELEELETEERFVKAALRSLKVASTQLKTIEARSGGEPFDEKAFEALPEHLRRRILTRLDNIAKRMAGASERDRPSEYADPAFQCLRDYERCRQTAKASSFWCQLAMVVCLLRTVLPSLAKLGPK